MHHEFIVSWSGGWFNKCGNKSFTNLKDLAIWAHNNYDMMVTGAVFYVDNSVHPGSLRMLGSFGQRQPLLHDR